MVSASASNGTFLLNAYRGDFKTLLAWNIGKAEAARLAGFTVHCRPQGRTPYYLYNLLTFAKPDVHARVEGEPDRSTANSPIHKFRWLHVPGLDHQGLAPLRGKYTYTVTPRYFDDDKHLLPLDASKGAAVEVQVRPFVKGNFRAGFTRGYVQSQAFVNHFSEKAIFEPKDRPLLFDIDEVVGTNKDGDTFTFRDEYDWSGFTAREAIFAVLDEVLADGSLQLDVFAYDLKEPDIIASFKALADVGRLRLILDDAKLHHSDPPVKEDDAAKYIAGGKKSVVKRGHFQRYAHHKVFIVSDGEGPRTVLTGSTNFAVTGMYVNSNHVLVYDDREVAGFYAGVFETAWKTDVSKPDFVKTEWSKRGVVSSASKTPPSTFHFSPHSKADAEAVLDELAARINDVPTAQGARRSVLFAVMSTGTGTGSVLDALEAVHLRDDLFSFGISDSPRGIVLYPTDKRTGVLVTGKPKATKMPKPFSKQPSLGLTHQIHHKFVVCDFNGDDPVVYCGSSNLALGGEKDNGDNLIAIRDGDVATVFAIEALALVDHFNFLGRLSEEADKKNKVVAPQASMVDAAQQAEWHLGVTDAWTRPYFKSTDLHFVDRMLFGS